MTSSADTCSENQFCRLCGGPTTQSFTATILLKRRIAYFKCQHCESLQSQLPDWLDEAYGTNLADIDTGAAQRNWNNLAIVFHVCKLFDLVNVLDYGAGDGLLCRLLRDYGINAFGFDKHAKLTYAKGFEADDLTQPEIIVAFEVLEHFDQPSSQLGELFERSARLVLVSTELYAGQGADWRYLMPTSGQHVFFYSRKALEDFARFKGYTAHFYGQYTLFTQNNFYLDKAVSGYRSLMLSLLLNRYGLQLFRLLMVARRPTGVEADFQRLISQIQSKPKRKE
ncbi:class I SAM-dependent methyltransferase [Limnobacter parvus]|uniref:Class I SAM-dependent methyltransferase n=1 Tax=Limnobacter parvus TaxID=2939690 RepID=A0ABT1XD89_9BURK|nr:class I SAM-dependent methyltransferase [Limnobacter parvus]MCR2745240.1 class I SAM-dependent methyltransferase [Limnobacter parvus]